MFRGHKRKNENSVRFDALRHATARRVPVTVLLLRQLTVVKNIIVAVVITAVLMIAACSKNQAPPEESEDVPEDNTPQFIDEVPFTPEPFTYSRGNFPRMDGSPSTIPLAQGLAAIMLGQSRGDVEELAYFSGTAQAFRNLARGQCDILIAGEPYPAVLDEIADMDFRYDMAPIATDALVFVVSRSNPVGNLTSEQVKAIYKGEITKWNEVGGDDIDITAFQRNEEALSQVLAEKLVMDWEKMADAPMQEIPGFYMYGGDNTPAVIKGFDGSESALGYTMYYYAKNMEMANGYKILSIDGIMPTPDTISSGDYPFINPYYAVISRDLPEDDNTRILYNWLLSEEGQTFISSEGYVSMQNSSERSGAVPAPPPDMKWNIVTDSSRLTPYKSPHSLSARIYDAALPELVPFDGYGPLLPYATGVTTNDGNIYAVKYGFVTAQSGMVVTDPVYDGIGIASIPYHSGDAPQISYRLYMDVPADESETGFRTVQAACAGDGSWITPFIYDNISFRENVIFLMRNAGFGEGTFDIDVYDYEGNCLYNVLELEWAERIAEDARPESLVYNEGSGYSFIMLEGGICAVLNVRSGEIRETDFKDAYMFSEGLALVVPSGTGELWGFVNTDLELVIPAEYVREAVFTDGRAIVETPDGAQHIINTNGEQLLSVPQGEMINRLYDSYGYAIYSFDGMAFPRYLTYEFDEIKYPQEALPLSEESSVSYLGGGGFLCTTEDGIWFFDADEAILMPASVQEAVSYVGGEYIIIAEYDEQQGDIRYGVIRKDGSTVITALSNQYIDTVFVADDIMFAVNAGIEENTPMGTIGASFTQLMYSLIDVNGRQIKRGPGILSYDGATGNISVLGTDHFAWLGASGNVFISIPSMAYTFD